MKAGEIVATNFYYLDDEQLYLGTIKLSNQDDIKYAIKNLELQISGDYATKAELVSVAEELHLALDENAYTLKEIKEQVAENATVLRDLKKTVENANSDFELRITTNAKDISTLKTDIATLQKISSGIGGESEPPTIVSAIESAKEEAFDFADNLMSWKDEDENK
jgi:prophage DNA circulation protein